MTPVRLLDLTRSLRRVGGMPTGIDRVERVYLEHFITLDAPVFGLIRTAFGYVLLDRTGMAALSDGLKGTVPWPPMDRLSRIPRRRNAEQRQAESQIRQNAVARCLPARLARMLGQHLQRGFHYYNVGHSNLTERVLNSVQIAGGKVHVMVHDVIPLEHPAFQKPDTLRPFKEKMHRVRRLAHRVIYNSQDTRDRAEAAMAQWGPLPQGVVAHLGVDVAAADDAAIPAGVMPDRLYFVTLGTIEPRKNHVFLLDLWAEMGADAPPLLICGSRGWLNEDVFARLDALPPDGPVREVGGLNDTAMAALVQNSAGTLFPSHAEGFGLPMVEAARLGARVLCNDLIVLREILGDAAHFTPVSDREKWLKTIKSWEKTPTHAGKAATTFVGPNWPDHFKTVLRLK